MSSSSSSLPASPSSHPTSSPSPSLPAWHFPFGPSSRYHHSERPRLNHSRTKSSYIPRAPVLSTEKRAHRRAQNSSFGSTHSTPLSECGRSPLSRFPSYTPRATTMAKQDDVPITPAKSPRRSTSSLQDSPFSDYFSDDARSSVHNHAIPCSETKALLVRMNKLQSQLMRDQSSTAQRRAISIVEKKLSEIELEISDMQSQQRQRDELEDSGVFMPQEEKHDVKSPSHSRGPSFQSVNSSAVFSDDTPTIDSYKAERDWLLLRMQELLENLNHAQSELRQRQVEVKELNDLHSVVMEEKDTAIEQLRYENEGLRQDLGFEYSELLFLKLQMKELECDLAELREEKDVIAPSSTAERSRREKKNRILAEMDRWRTDSDWQDVEARFKRRRSKYGVPTSPVSKDSAPCKTHDAAVDEGEVDWQLETQRGDSGRVTSLTIKRTSSSHEIPPAEQTNVTVSSPEQEKQTVTLNGTTDFPARILDEPTPSKLRSLKTAEYTETGTQTDLDLQPPPPPTFPPLDEEDLFSTSDSEPEPEDDECAITTSSEADADTDEEEAEDPYQDVEEDEETIVEAPTLLNVTPPQKSAWQELWASLQSLSGMGDDEDE